MNTDQELVEMAARAMGVQLEWNESGESGYWDDFRGLPQWVPWSPLKDPGDAFMLALRCGIEIGYGAYGDNPEHVWASIGGIELSEPVGGNIFLAGARVVTRVAAVMGRVF